MQTVNNQWAERNQFVRDVRNPLEIGGVCDSTSRLLEMLGQIMVLGNVEAQNGDVRTHSGIYVVHYGASGLLETLSRIRVLGNVEDQSGSVRNPSGTCIPMSPHALA